jgi:hypothetical protein
MSATRLNIHPVEEEDSKKRGRLMIASTIFGASVFGTLALTAPFVFMRSPLPYMATPGRKVYQALHYLKRSQQKYPNRTFVDMGSGDGEAVYQALKVGYQKAVGIELNYTLYAIAQCRRLFFWTPDERARSTFLCQDFFKYNLEHADTVMIFGVNPLMNKSINRKRPMNTRTVVSFHDRQHKTPRMTTATCFKHL